jgi:hypothetical protein
MFVDLLVYIVTSNVLKLFGECGLKVTTKLINTIYGTGVWPKDFTDVTKIALRKKSPIYKMHRTSQNQTYRTYSEESNKDT